jgi:hypothetical protein
MRVAVGNNCDVVYGYLYVKNTEIECAINTAPWWDSDHIIILWCHLFVKHHLERDRCVCARACVCVYGCSVYWWSQKLQWTSAGVSSPVSMVCSAAHRPRTVVATAVSLLPAGIFLLLPLNTAFIPSEGLPFLGTHITARDSCHSCTVLPCQKRSIIWCIVTVGQFTKHEDDYGEECLVDVTILRCKFTQILGRLARVFKMLYSIVFANKLACEWRHNSRKLVPIILVIQNAFDYGLDYTTWTAIQNWDLR